MVLLLPALRGQGETNSFPALLTDHSAWRFFTRPKIVTAMAIGHITFRTGKEKLRIRYSPALEITKLKIAKPNSQVL